jgi:hypothetical protein
MRFDAAGKITGLTIIKAKWLLERDGELTVTSTRAAARRARRDRGCVRRGRITLFARAPGLVGRRM